MFKNAKVVTLAFALVVSTSIISAPAQSAERPVSVPGCAKSTAKGHAPAKVKQPTVAAKSPAKTLTLTTNCGPIVISLLGSKAPITVTSIAALANAGYYNKSLCHRLTTEGIFVLQCGDPTASGSGSPTGWKGYIDENLPKVGAKNYPAGTVAMANSGPKTNGSQFFLVYQDTQLGPNYTIWGKITKGLDLVQKIGAVGAYQMSGEQAMYAPDGFPIQMVEIVKATAK
ncbi:peptidyl-prolyl cis-trans isomerase B (cyclophilin B) [Candidatus Planktophila sulfonica]|uniref:Peptidyl-prolyl cis-trans isomerase n=1 Tax=Candidatus Planktophila sulfonica TaxID=1884904 RepID=A0A249KHL6_9ACTN|nr:peptidylprolyl isomerase [Candidatus Planktophila sulfonica]ASY16308.1 peptidyl-prolyl cis-trans isomerase B (cyclophilin B) [Candidatus Planktophila sulfonica]